MNKPTLPIDYETSQVFNKMDILIRDAKIYLQYCYLREVLAVPPIQACKLISEKEFKSWKGESYFLGEKAIQKVIYDYSNNLKGNNNG